MIKAGLTFYNGTDGATGSEFVLKTPSLQILVDCGLTQGMQEFEDRNREPFAHDPKETDVLLVTHAHMDHIGRIPRFVRDGFRGRIISTIPTKDLAALMFQDALKVMNLRELEHDEEPLYTKEDVERSLELWEGATYHESVRLGELTASFLDAGHILGSAMVRISGPQKSILFSGDLGNTPHDLLSDTEHPGDISYLVMESVYGNRNHENKDERPRLLRAIIERVRAGRGRLLIPVFSLERSQDILFELNKLVEDEGMQEIPVFLDSPLAIRITELYAQYPEWLNSSVQERIKKGDNIFSFSGLTPTYTKEESKEIGKVSDPKIIIAGSGMSHGGRIQHHEIDYLSDPKTTILFVGYQIPGSIGRRILDGSKTVKIFKKDVRVRARVESIFSYSAHKDMDHLTEFAGQAGNLEKLFIVLGEPQSRMFLAQRIREYHGITPELPERRSSYEIEL